MNVILQQTWYFMRLLLKCLLNHISGLSQDCGNSIADAMELPQSCAKPSLYSQVPL